MTKDTHYFKFVLLLLVTTSLLRASNQSQTELYFAYGSNMSNDFLYERLKDGIWTEDGWHKTGTLRGPIPEELGTYRLDNYEFSYNIVDIDSLSKENPETAGNIIEKNGSCVYGVLYKITKEQLALLDETEDEPENYKRVLVKVHQVAMSSEALATNEIKSKTSWAYIGTSKYLTAAINPDPEYIKLLIDSARKRNFPEEYIEKHLQLPNLETILHIKKVAMVQ